MKSCEELWNVWKIIKLTLVIYVKDIICLGACIIRGAVAVLDVDVDRAPFIVGAPLPRRTLWGCGGSCQVEDLLFWNSIIDK